MEELQTSAEECINVLELKRWDRFKAYKDLEDCLGPVDTMSLHSGHADILLLLNLRNFIRVISLFPLVTDKGFSLSFAPELPPGPNSFGSGSYS